jgi:hypothetical protein
LLLLRLFGPLRAFGTLLLALGAIRPLLTLLRRSRGSDCQRRDCCHQYGFVCHIQIPPWFAGTGLPEIL